MIDLQFLQHLIGASYLNVICQTLQCVCDVYYSNFDKHHNEDYHRAQCTKPTPLALDNFQHFSSQIQQNFQW